MTRSGLVLVVLLAGYALATQAGCTDGGGPSGVDTRPDAQGPDAQSDRGPTTDRSTAEQATPDQTGLPADGSGADGSGTDGSGTDGSGADGSGADAGKPTLPPPPPGAVLLRISVQDKYGNYGPGEVRLKGAFKYNPTTHVITPDAAWTGPSVGLHDDGSLGLEGPGTVAGDRKLGAVVYIVPSGPLILEYGLESPAGWFWPAKNASITIKPGAPPLDLPSTTVAPRDGVDLLVRVDRFKLKGRTFDPGSETVTLRGDKTHWAALPCNDFGEAGDAKQGDGVFTCRLSAQLGSGKRFPHLGLLRPGDSFRFLVDIAGKAYTETAGVSAQLQGASQTVSAALAKVSGNLQLGVPATLKDRQAPPPPPLGLPAGKRGDLPGGRYDLSTAPAGIKGYYYVPSWYDVHSALPLLVALHGATEKGIWMINVWEQLARDQGFVLLAPTSFGKTSWNWVYGKTPSEEQAILSAVSWLKSRYAIKAGHVGVNGFSDGASMALRMGLQNPAVFAAILANSAGSTGSAYKASPPIKIYLSHGEADKILPYANALAIKNSLIKAGFDVTWVSFPTGHPYQHHVFPTAEKIPMLRWLAKAAR